MEEKKLEKALAARAQYIKPTITKTRRPYVKPAVSKLTSEQAKLKLLGAAGQGDQGAMELLELMFPEVRPKKTA